MKNVYNYFVIEYLFFGNIKYCIFFPIHLGQEKSSPEHVAIWNLHLPIKNTAVQRVKKEWKPTLVIFLHFTAIQCYK